MASLASEDSAGEVPEKPTMLLRQLTAECDMPMDDSEDGSAVDGSVAQEGSSGTRAPEEQGTERKLNGKMWFSCGGIKDEGVPGKQNQDDFFIWSSSKNDNANDAPSTLIIACLDGHGRELGQLASQAAKDVFFDRLTNEAALNRLRADPKKEMKEAFRAAHDGIRQAFCEHYTSIGVETMVTDGYILKRRKGSTRWSCVHGGTTVSLVVILDKKTLISANTGDSTAVLYGCGSDIFNSSARIDATYEAEVPKAPPGTPGPQATGPESFTLITADHGPENPVEFYRMREFRPSASQGSRFSEMLFVYDSQRCSKFDCPHVFAVDSSGKAEVTNHGRYYKSVRNEWASLCTTPANAEYQDALAFTRSCGDLHLHTYGVTCEPDIVCLDLQNLLQSAKLPAVALVVCSDGVWDNWQFRDVGAFFMGELEKVASTDAQGTKGGSKDAIVQGTDSVAIDIATRFMDVNKQIAFRNFGNSADNMTAIVCRIFNTQTN
eukprot:g741.t1